MISFGFSKEKEKIKALLENNIVWLGFLNLDW
jgi:hypothetical protein